MPIGRRLLSQFLQLFQLFDFVFPDMLEFLDLSLKEREAYWGPNVARPERRLPFLERLCSTVPSLTRVCFICTP